MTDEIETMGRMYFTRREALYDLLVMNRDEQKKNIALWSSLQTNKVHSIPDRYFPQCIHSAIKLIKSENLNDLHDALNHFVLGDSVALDKIKQEYQTKMDEMDEPFILLQDALVEAELEHASLINLQKLIWETDKFRK
jgi:hypothetical protein